MNSPRDTFRAKPGNISKLRDLVDSFIFTEAATVASMQQVENQSVKPAEGVDAIQHAAQNHWKLQGAREYLGILLGLCDPEPNQRKPRQSLDHNAG